MVIKRNSILSQIKFTPIIYKIFNKFHPKREVLKLFLKLEMPGSNAQNLHQCAKISVLQDINIISNDFLTFGVIKSA